MARRKVFGIGFDKTGTSTLGACLRRLGCKHVSHSGVYRRAAGDAVGGRVTS